MTAENSEIILSELRHAFDTVYASVRKYTDKTFMNFGAEITFLIFYLSSDEIKNIKTLFGHPETGWYVFALFTLIGLVAATVLFIIALTIGKWSVAPDENILLSRNQYSKMKQQELLDELIVEYNANISSCAKKVATIKKLSDIGMYLLVFSITCLLIIKFFGVQ